MPMFAPYKDIVSKDLLKRLILDMARYLFALPLQDAVILDQEKQRIEDRRADLAPPGTGSTTLSGMRVASQGCGRHVDRW